MAKSPTTSLRQKRQRRSSNQPQFVRLYGSDSAAIKTFAKIDIRLMIGASNSDIPGTRLQSEPQAHDLMNGAEEEKIESGRGAEP